jgi:YfiH family protein
MTVDRIPLKTSERLWLAGEGIVRWSAERPGLYRIFDQDPRVLAGFSGREYSRDQYPQFIADLGLSSANLVCVKQEHTSDLFVPEDSKSENKVQVADGIVTAQRGIAVGVRTADCVPLFCYDPTKQVIAIVHAGWKGSWKGIAGSAVKLMADRFGCDYADILAVIGPCIRFCCYEVGEEFRNYFPDFYKLPPQQPADSRAHVDLPAAIKADLLRTGMIASNISDVAVCNACHHDRFFSARRGDGEGRILSVMALLPL